MDCSIDSASARQPGVSCITYCIDGDLGDVTFHKLQGLISGEASYHSEEIDASIRVPNQSRCSCYSNEIDLELFLASPGM